jgi:hypothetical protein
MLTIRESVRIGAAIITGIAGLLVARFVFYDYVPPEGLIRDLERSMFVTTGMRKSAGAVFAAVSMIMMAVFFRLVQQCWPGRRGAKGLVFGASLGIIWSFGFFTGWAFLGTTLRADVLNSVVDLIALAFAGWLIGLAVGHNVAKSTHRMWKPWLAVLLVAFGFVSVHALGARLFAGFFTATADLLLLPTTLAQISLLAGLGLWAGVMYVMLHTGLPFNKTWARVAFFAFGVFGHCWTLFHLFFVIEFAGVLPVLLVVGLLGATGVFVGALAYEGIASGRRQVD